MFKKKRKLTQLTPIFESSLIKDSNQLFWCDIQNLPHCLLIEILASLHVKSIFRFKCVNKPLISHPSFSILFFSILNSYKSSLFPFNILYRYIYISNVNELVNRFHPENYTCPRFSLLYLYSIKERHLCSHSKVIAITTFVIQFLVNGLVYLDLDLIPKVNLDNMIISYRIVRMKMCDSMSDYLEVEKCSSKTGKWVAFRLYCTKEI